jgi:glutathione S-transferase
MEARSFDVPSAATTSRYYHLALAPIASAGEEHGGGVGVGETESEQQLRRVLSVYDDALARTRYLAGDEFTLADMSHLLNAHRLAGSEMGRTPLGSVKNVARWYETTRPSPHGRRGSGSSRRRAAGPPSPVCARTINGESQQLPLRRTC